MVASCERGDPLPAQTVQGVAPDSRGTESAQASLDPVGVVRRVHDLRLARKWFEWVGFIVPEQRDAVTQLVRATDALLDADDHLQRIIIDRYGLAAAIPFDRSQSGNAISVLSIDMRTLDQHVDGDRAFVTIQVADRVPLERVELVRRDGRWLIQTDPPIQGVPEQIERLAGVLNDVAGRIEHEGVTIEQARRELEDKQAPVLRTLVRLTEAGS